eukprot:750488-Hanusia_phi.AAC.3
MDLLLLVSSSAGPLLCANRLVSDSSDRDNSPLRLPGGAGKQQQRYISPLRNPVGQSGGIQAYSGRGGKRQQDRRLVSSYDFED